jgi:hypothetical protein
MGKYPEFEGYEPLLELVYGQMKASGFAANTKEEAFEAVANRARDLKAKFSPVAGGQQSKPTSQAALPKGGTRMSTVTAGGQGGPGGGSGGKMSIAKALFSH